MKPVIYLILFWGVISSRAFGQQVIPWNARPLHIFFPGFPGQRLPCIRLQAHWQTIPLLLFVRADDSTMEDKAIGPLEDAQRALLIVRTRAREWQIAFFSAEENVDSKQVDCHYRGAATKSK